MRTIYTNINLLQYMVEYIYSFGRWNLPPG